MWVEHQSNVKKASIEAKIIKHNTLDENCDEAKRLLKEINHHTDQQKNIHRRASEAKSEDGRIDEAHDLNQQTQITTTRRSPRLI